MHIELMNAPPQTGKDTICAAIKKRYPPVENVYILSFKTPLFKLVATALGMTYTNFMYMYNDVGGWKDEPREDLGGKTIRDLMKHTSENYIKPFFGDSYFGDELVKSIKSFPANSVILIPDGGFPAEVYPLIEAFGADNLFINKIKREGYDNFDNDTRKWLNIPEVKTTIFDTTNGNDEIIEHVVRNIKFKV